MSGWTALTIMTDEPTELEVKLKKSGFIGQHDDVRSTTEYVKDGEDRGKVEVRLSGYDRDGDARDLLNEFVEFIEEAVLINANNTSDSGTGEYIVPDDEDELDVIETEQGYEGACARDVTGYFNEEYGFLPHTGYR